MNTVIFWVVWAVVAALALKTFYFSFTKGKLQLLRRTALLINVLVLILGFVPLFLTFNAKSVLELFSWLNILAVVFSALLFVSTALFLSSGAIGLKVAAMATMINTFAYFGVMYGLRPGTFVLTKVDIFPILAALLLLVNNVIVLLIWQQLKLREKKLKIKKGEGQKALVIICLASLVVATALFTLPRTMSKANEGKLAVDLVSELPEVREFKKAVEEGGRSKFYVEMAAKPTKDEPYYLIQVFEVFPDHRATFGWYKYYPKTKLIDKAFSP